LCGADDYSWFYQDGLTGDYSLLAIKSLLDGFAALAFASSAGDGSAVFGIDDLDLPGRSDSAGGFGPKTPSAMS
jgi:hypothetical protein